MRMLAQLINVLMVVLMSLTLLVGADTGQDAEDQTQARCPVTFQFLFQTYQSCAPSRYREENGTSIEPLSHRHMVSPNDVISELQRVCSLRERMRRCMQTTIGPCPASLKNIHQAAVDKAMSLCRDSNDEHDIDNDNNNSRAPLVRPAIIQALNAGSPVPDVEKNVSNCIGNRRGMERCAGDLLGQDRFSQIRDYGDVIRHPAEEVLSNPVALSYFDELFDCYWNVVYPNCPHNTVAMILASQYHLILPPKYGINLTEIILDKMADVSVP